jgi:hypothetical protein
MHSVSRAEQEPKASCLACGRELRAVLAFGASLRCDDCRATKAPLSAELVYGASAAEPDELAA